jgi:nicotinamidase-related amidase
MIDNPRKAWRQVFEEKPPLVETLRRYIEEHIAEDEQVVAAMDGTALSRLTGRVFNWKQPPWGVGRSFSKNFLSPEGVKLIVVRSQWPYLTREVTWTMEILEALSRKELKAEEIVWKIPDTRYRGAYPFPYARDRQVWPKVQNLRGYLLKHPVTAEEAQKIMARASEKLLRPEGVSEKALPDLIWGYEESASSK